jgi:AcrR family transcriptional regulator
VSICGPILGGVAEGVWDAQIKRPRYDPDRLLEVAVQEFIGRGYEATSMAQLASAAGLGKASIYHHFPSKEAILNRALSRALGALFGVLEEDGARVGPPASRLEYLLSRTVEVLVAELPYVTLLLRVRGNSKTELWALERRRQFDRKVGELVAATASTGALREGLDPGLGARLLLGMVNSISEWYRPGGALSSSDLARMVAAVGLHGISEAARPGAVAAGGPMIGR